MQGTCKNLEVETFQVQGFGTRKEVRSNSQEQRQEAQGSIGFQGVGFKAQGLIGFQGVGFQMR